MSRGKQKGCHFHMALQTEQTEIKALMVRDPMEYEYTSYGLFIQEPQESQEGKAAEILSGLVDTSPAFFLHSAITRVSSTACSWKGRFPMLNRKCCSRRT